MKLRGTQRHREIIDQREILMNQYRKELTRTEENKLNEIRIEEQRGCAETVQTQKYRADLRHTQKLVLALKAR